jgi:hypothetical protein
MADLLEQHQEVIKGGKCCFELSIERGPKGLILFVRAMPEVENFIKSLCDGGVDPVEMYSREWFSVDVAKPVYIHRLERDIPTASSSYTIAHPGEPLRSKEGKYNISFLRIVGIGSPEGVTFGVAGPFSKEFIRIFMEGACKEVRTLISEYIVPVHINLRISSQEI